MRETCQKNELVGKFEVITPTELCRDIIGCTPNNATYVARQGGVYAPLRKKDGGHPHYLMEPQVRLIAAVERGLMTKEDADAEWTDYLEELKCRLTAKPLPPLPRRQYNRKH